MDSSPERLARNDFTAFCPHNEKKIITKHPACTQQAASSFAIASRGDAEGAGVWGGIDWIIRISQAFVNTTISRGWCFSLPVDSGGGWSEGWKKRHVPGKAALQKKGII
jgi:hypothetical protein